MSMPVIRIAICSAILCCETFALGQSARAGNAQVDVSVSSVQAAAMAGTAVNASVSAIAMPSYGAGESGAGRSHPDKTTMTDAGLRMTSQHFAESRLAPRSSAAVRMNGGSSTIAVARRGSRDAGISAKESASLRTHKTGRAASRMMKVAAAGHGTAGAEKRVGSSQSGLSWVESTYTADFPDSTKRTALVSPPDLGAFSPLEWSPHMSVGLPDLSTRQFLSLSLHPDSKSGMKGRGKRAGLFGRKKPLSENPLVQPPSTSVSAGADLILSPAGSLLSVPDTSLPTSVDQQ